VVSKVAWEGEAGMGNHLKVTADDDDVDAIPATLLAGPFNGGVDGVQGSVALYLLLDGLGMLGVIERAILTQPSTATRTPCDSNVSIATDRVGG
jgi:hypothetical protein